MSRFAITGVEATQSIQYFGSTYPLNNGQPFPDNSIPLVERRRTVLRVYVAGATPGNVVGALLLSSGAGGPLGVPNMVQGSWITAGTQPARRLAASDTVQIALTVQEPGTWSFNVLATEFDSRTGVARFAPLFPLPLTFERRWPVALRLVRIRCERLDSNGRPVVFPAPTTADFWASLQFAHRVLPVRMPGFRIVRDSEELYDGDFTIIDPSAYSLPANSPNNGTTGNLPAIMERLLAAESFPFPVIYVGLYPWKARQTNVLGFSSSTWILSEENQETMAHELTHQLCVPDHAPCGSPPGVDPTYPAYGANQSGSIGEVGFDPLREVVYDPSSRVDLMSYCGPKWISPHNYVRVLSCWRLSPPPGEPPEPLQPLFPLETVPLDLVQGPNQWVRVPYPPVPRRATRRGVKPDPRAVVTLYDHQRRAIETLRATREPVSAESGPLELFRLHAEIPVRPEAAFLDVTIDGKLVFEDALEGRAPALRVRWPRTDQLRRGVGTLRWTVRGKVGGIVVRATNDGGASWAARVLPGTQRTLNLADGVIQPGDSCRLEVFAVDRYRFARATSRPFKVARRAAELLIISPRTNTVHHSGEPLTLAAVSPVTDARISWHSNRDGYLGEAAFLVSLDLSPGRHMIEARSDQQFDKPARVDVRITNPRKARTTRRGPRN